MFNNIKNLFPGSKQVVGLDIGSSSLKLAEILETPKGYLLNHFSQISLPRGVIVDGVVVEQEQLTEKIKELFKYSGCKRKRIVTSLSGHSVIIKKVSFPVMDEGELRDLINDEAGKYLPFDSMTEVNFDFQTLGENEFNPNQLDVLLVAAKKNIIAGYTEAVKNAGLSVVIMDVDSFALETMYEENYDFAEDDVDVLVNIGASITNINVVKNGISVFTRDFNLGGNAITEAIGERLRLTFEEAEKIKIEGPDGDELAKSEFRESMLTYTDPLCSEIERSIDYFKSTYGREEIKHVLLSGGGAKIPGIAADLFQRLSIETEIINPFKKIVFNRNVLEPDYLESIAPIATVGVGLALRREGDR
ncbi:MAG: type IV pilus assembly protein PilM [Syntrophales bacterium]|nr:type IV pilus assembly protein PilM [Syntrophales bacterium]